MKKFFISCGIVITAVVIVLLVVLLPASVKKIDGRADAVVEYDSRADLIHINGYRRIGFSKMKLYVIDAQGNKQEPVVVDVESVRIIYYEFD